MRFQFGVACTARCHGQHLCANRPSAADVQWRVADDHNFLTAQFPAQHAAAALTCDGGNLIAILPVIREAARFEMFPQSEVAQLDFRSEPDVAGEQSQQRRLGQCLQISDQLADAGTFLRLTFLEQMMQPMNVALEEPREVGIRRRDAVQPKEFADEADIGASGEFHPLDAVTRAELGGEHLRKRPDARASGVDERAINVEENESNHVGAQASGTHRAAAMRFRQTRSPLTVRLWTICCPCMKAITYTAARESLAATMDKVCRNRTPILITRNRDQSVVMLSLEDYEQLEETAYLLRSPENARRLLSAIGTLEKGRGRERKVALET